MLALPPATVARRTDRSRASRRHHLHLPAFPTPMRSYPSTPTLNYARSRVEEACRSRDLSGGGQSTGDKLRQHGPRANGHPRIAYREDDRNASPYRLASIKLRRLAQPQIFHSITLPTGHRGAVQQDFHTVASGQRGYNLSLLVTHRRLRTRC